MTIRRALRRLLALASARRLDRDLDSEILAHLELAERDALARGLSPEDARRYARLQFGGLQQVRELHRDRRAVPWLAILSRDLRSGLAALRRAPAFTALTASVLALGIGANVAMFGLVDAVLLKPLPFPNSARIVQVWEAPRPGVVNAASAPEFLDWRRQSAVFDAVSAEVPLSVTLAAQDGPAKISGKAVTPAYFRVFGASTVLGRTFTPSDAVPGAAPVIVLSHAAWLSDFGADPDILLRRPLLDGEPHQIVGVLAPGPFDRDETRFWKPLAFSPDKLVPEIHWLTVFARLAPGVSLAQANSRMQAANAAFLPSKPADDREGTTVVAPLSSLLIGNGLERSIAVAFGAVTLVLLIACANVVNLLLARGALRRREIAVRAALGAGRARLVAQLLTESSLLCFLGAAAGLAAASLLIRAARPLLADLLPFTADVTLDTPVLLFALALSFAVALLVGALPAFRVSFHNLAATLNRSARSASLAHARTRRAIVAAEVALSLLLLSGALLLLRSLLNLRHVDTGVRIENIVTMSADLPPAAYPSPEKAALFYSALRRNLLSAPGVSNAGLATVLPLQWISNGEVIFVPGAEAQLHIRFKRVDPGYFSSLDIPLLAGRGITSQDRPGAPRVIVVNRALASRLASFPALQNPIGKLVRVSAPTYLVQEDFIPQVEIVGVIRDERVSSPGQPDPPVVYAALAQSPSSSFNILARTSVPLAAALPAIRRAVHQTDPTLALSSIATMEQVRSRTLAGASRPAALIASFAAIAILLTAVGLYGVLAQAVTLRRREIGIRIVLGGAPSDVVFQILRNAFSLVAAGLASGLIATFALTRVLKNLLFEISPLDPASLAAACLAIAAIALAAALIPAARAATLNPAATLRDEA